MSYLTDIGRFAYIIIFLLGLALGSFLNSWIWRAHENFRIINGRSMCPHCRNALRPPLSGCGERLQARTAKRSSRKLALRQKTWHDISSSSPSLTRPIRWLPERSRAFGERSLHTSRVRERNSDGQRHEIRFLEGQFLSVLADERIEGLKTESFLYINH